MYIFSPRLRLISIFVLLYFTTFSIWAVLTQNYEFMLYEAQMIIMMALIIYMDKRCTFSGSVLWALALWGFLHLAGGLVPIPDSIADMKEASPTDTVQVLYNMRLSPYLPRYDNFIHAFGFGTCAVLAKQALSAHLGRTIPMNLPMGAAVFLIALGLGCINELIEFTAVLLIPDTNVGGYKNTGWDLVSNAVGAGLAIIAMKLSLFEKKA